MNWWTTEYHLGFEVLTAVVMRSTIFWDITVCSPLSVNRRFGGNILPPSSGSKNKPSKEPAWEQVTSRSLLSRCFLTRLILRPRRWWRNVPSETSVDTQRTTHRYIPEDSTLQQNKMVWSRSKEKQDRMPRKVLNTELKGKRPTGRQTTRWKPKITICDTGGEKNMRRNWRGWTSGDQRGAWLLGDSHQLETPNEDT
jgi:hypothetical protein